MYVLGLTVPTNLGLIPDQGKAAVNDVNQRLQSLSPLF